jgi:hypothetical protein
MRVLPSVTGPCSAVTLGSSLPSLLAGEGLAVVEEPLPGLAGDPPGEAFGGGHEVQAQDVPVTGDCGPDCEVPTVVRDPLGRVRSDGATARLLAVPPENPVLSADEAEAKVGGATSAAYRAVDRLVRTTYIGP